MENALFFNFLLIVKLLGIFSMKMGQMPINVREVLLIVAGTSSGMNKFAYTFIYIIYYISENLETTISMMYSIIQRSFRAAKHNFAILR